MMQLLLMNYLLNIEIYGLNKGKIQKLQGESLMKFSHSIKRMIGTLTLDDDLSLSKISPKVRKQIYKEMRDYFYPLYVSKDISEDELKHRIAKAKHEFYAYDNSDSFSPDAIDADILAKVSEYEQVISNEKVSDAFPKSRYGHLDEYTPNIDALFYLAQGIRRSIKLQYENAITVADAHDAQDISFGRANEVRFIFPDIDSKIYVFDGDKKCVTRVYNFEKYIYDSSWIIDAGKEEYLPQLVHGHDLLFDSYSEGLTEDEIKKYEDTIRMQVELPESYICLNEGSKEVSLIYFSEGKPELVFLKGNRIISKDLDREPWLINAIEEYEKGVDSIPYRPTNKDFENSVSESILMSGLNNEILRELEATKEKEEEK